MTHKEIMKSLTGILLGMFVAVLSSTIVSNALPKIIHDLDGGQTAYTWVVTATLLAMTASTPIWGKLADLFSKKLLIQIAISIYVVGSALAGLSQNTSMLIGCRVIQGLGVGGLISLAQVIMAVMIPPRERGRYGGYLGSVFALATVGGPLIGGVIVDSFLGWRWCFYVGVPFAVAALVVLQKTLHLPVVKRKVQIDYLGAFLITAGVSLLLIWVSLGGKNYDWVSAETAMMVPGAIVLLALAIFVESKAAEPIIPLSLFKNRSVTMAIIASLAVGLAMMGASVFLGQYFQLARGKSPTMSGLMTLPMVAGVAIVGTVVGKRITATGKWKHWLIMGGVVLTVGLGLMGTARSDTNLVLLSVFMFLVGSGVGAMQQNLVLAVQNSVPLSEMGTASSTVAFFRSLGGAIGVSALGAVMGNRVIHYTTEGGMPAGGGGGGIPDLKALPGPVRDIVENAYGHGVGDVFLYAAPFGIVALIAVFFIKETVLKTSNTEVATKTPDTVNELDDAVTPLAVGADLHGADEAKEKAVR